MLNYVSHEKNIEPSIDDDDDFAPKIFLNLKIGAKELIAFGI